MKIDMTNFPRTTTILAFGGLVLFGAVLGLLFFVELPDENVSTFNLALGALIGWVGAAFVFYFGDTKRGQQQADTIASLTQSVSDQTPTPKK